jgi:hypothetical protein
MKNLIILNLLLLSQMIMAQNQEHPNYFMNNYPFSIDSIFLDFNSIQSINVKKETPGGEIYITTKTQPWEYYTLDEILKSSNQYPQIIDNSIIPVYIIDGKVINKKSDTKIDKRFFTKIELISLSNVSGLSGKSKRIVIVRIELTTKDPKKDIRIRGIAFPNQ